MARKRYGKSRQAAIRTRVGIATAILAGSGSIAAVAVAATSHGAATAVQPAAYSARYSNEGTALNLVINDWGKSRQSAYAELADLTQARQFSQASHDGHTLDVQRGIVVLATRKFLILRSANGSLHLWLLSGSTKFQDVSDTTAGTSALTASTSATEQAMDSGNMVPATTLLAGSPTVAADLLTPSPAAQTVSVQVANTDLTVTVTVTRSTATVSADRHHAIEQHAVVGPEHVHPERVAGHEVAHPRRPGPGGRLPLALDAARPGGPVHPASYRDGEWPGQY